MEASLEHPKIRAQVITTSVVVFIVMLGVGIVAPILPIYAKSFAGSYTLASLVISAFGLARLLFDVPSGSLSDRFGRRPVIIAGIIVFAVGGLLSGLAVDFYTLLGARFLQGLGASVYTTSALAYVADIVPPANRGKYLAYYQGSFSLGLAVGPALGGFLVRPELGGLRGPFFILSAMALASAIFAFLNLKPPGRYIAPRVKTSNNGSLASAAMRMIGSRNVLVVNFGAVVTFLSISGIRGTAIPFYGVDYLRLSEPQVGIVLGVSALVNFLSIRRSGTLVDRLGGKRMIMYGFLSTTLSLLLFTYAWNFESMILFAALFGFTTSLASSSVATSAVEVSDPSRRGFSLGIYRVFNDIGIITGPILSGLLLEKFGFSFPFIGIAILAFMVGVTATAVMKAPSPLASSGEP